MNRNRQLLLAADGTIVEDVICECDYNLRGVSPVGRCPECGAEVADALAHRGVLDVPWARRVRLGMAITVAAWFLSVPVARRVFEDDGGKALLAILVHAALVVGCWMMTTREPRTVWRREIRRWRSMGCGAGAVVLLLDPFYCAAFKHHWVAAWFMAAVLMSATTLHVFAVASAATAVSSRLSPAPFRRLCEVLKWSCSALFATATVLVLTLIATIREGYLIPPSVAQTWIGKVDFFGPMPWPYALAAYAALPLILWGLINLAAAIQVAVVLMGIVRVQVEGRKGDQRSTKADRG